MEPEDNIESNQIRNIKNKIVDHIRKSTVKELLKIAVFCKVKVPKALTDKYLK